MRAYWQITEYKEGEEVMVDVIIKKMVGEHHATVAQIKAGVTLRAEGGIFLLIDSKESWEKLKEAVKYD